MRLERKTALITGGGGMGGAQARLFAREGAAICVADLFLEKAQLVAKEIDTSGARALAVSHDVRRAVPSMRRGGGGVITGSMLTVDGGAAL